MDSCRHHASTAGSRQPRPRLQQPADRTGTTCMSAKAPGLASALRELSWIGLHYSARQDLQPCQLAHALMCTSVVDGGWQQLVPVGWDRLTNGSRKVLKGPACGRCCVWTTRPHRRRPVPPHRARRPPQSSQATAAGPSTRLPGSHRTSSTSSTRASIVPRCKMVR